MRSSQSQNRVEYPSALITDVSTLSRDSFNNHLMDFEMNLRNENDVLEMCLNFAGSSAPASLHTEFNRLRSKVTDEIAIYHGMRSQRQFSQSQLSMLKLSYNKILLEFERIIASNHSIQEIANRFPRQQQLQQVQDYQYPSQSINSQAIPNKNNINYYAPGDNSPDSSLKFSPLLPAQSQQQIGLGSVAVLSKILSKPPLTQTSFHSINNTSTLGKKQVPSSQPQLYQSQQSSMQQLLNNSNSAAAQAEGVIFQAAKRDSVEKSNKEFIKRELLDIKASLQAVTRKIDAHEHSEYELELDQLQRENNAIMHDYKILKNDNTEIMHSLRMLSAIAQEIKLQNESMLSTLNSNHRQQLSQQHQSSKLSQGTPANLASYQTEPKQLQVNTMPTRQESRLKAQNSPNPKNTTSGPTNNHNAHQMNSRQKHIDSIRKLDLYNDQQESQDGFMNSNKVITRSSTRATTSNQHPTSFPQMNIFAEVQTQQPYSSVSNKNSIRNNLPRQLIPDAVQNDNEDDNNNNELLSSWVRNRI